MEWSEARHGTGIPEVDEQHRLLFQSLAELTEAMDRGIENKHLKDQLDFLSVYSELHFNCEELHMTERRCRNCALNRSQHDHFRAILAELREQHKQGKPISELANRIRDLLVPWLDSHIAGVDSELRNT